MFLHSLWMQETKNTQTRKDHATSFSKKQSPWYQRALQAVLLLWTPRAAAPKAARNATGPPPPARLRKCSSLKVASSFTRVCLCAPMSSYTEVFQADVPPRRSYSYPRAASAPPAARAAAGEGRRVFRGKSLTDDVLMRRFVVDEEATRRRSEMEVIRKRHAVAARRRRLEPSRLSRMALAEAVEAQEEL